MKRDPTHPSASPEKPPAKRDAGDDQAPFAAPLNLETFKRASTAAPRRYSENAPTIVPPKTEQEMLAGGAERDPFDFELPAGEDNGRATITNEVELEAARIQSVVMRSSPPPRPPSSGEEDGNLLSMANAQAPTVPPPRDYDSATMIAAPASTAQPQFNVMSLEAPLEAEILETKPIEPIAEMRDRFSLGDYTGALQLAEALVHDEATAAEAQTCAVSCRKILIKMYSARIGSLDRVPVVMVPHHQMRWLSIDHRAGFVLSHIDGMSSLEMILDVSGMPPLDALRILCELVQQRIISFR